MLKFVLSSLVTHNVLQLQSVVYFLEDNCLTDLNAAHTRYKTSI